MLKMYASLGNWFAETWADSSIASRREERVHQRRRGQRKVCANALFWGIQYTNNFPQNRRNSRTRNVRRRERQQQHHKTIQRSQRGNVYQIWCICKILGVWWKYQKKAQFKKMAAQNGDLLFPSLDNGCCVLMAILRKFVIQLVPHMLLVKTMLHPLGDLPSENQVLEHKPKFPVDDTQ